MIFITDSETNDEREVSENMYVGIDYTLHPVVVSTNCKDVATYMIDNGALNDLSEEAIIHAQMEYGGKWLRYAKENRNIFNEIFEDIYSIQIVPFEFPHHGKIRVDEN